ncbi:MAG: prepilin-type N-terminal cleavage/methylation domain-containing protein [Candidatus Omnitrophica bacterium]|nr:prepilin-type N-terminal cleavage/methylation domain-containing protein [Candidatus Omnitrophota bacterium]
MNKALTLIELMMVVVVVGIVATIAYPFYTTAKERALDKEAIANLKLIQKAEKIFRMDTGNYYPSSGTITEITAINANLSLDIPSGANRNWNYSLNNTLAIATRADNSRSWSCEYSSAAEPTCANEAGAGVKCP